MLQKQTSTISNSLTSFWLTYDLWLKSLRSLVQFITLRYISTTLQQLLYYKRCKTATAVGKLSPALTQTWGLSGFLLVYHHHLFVSCCESYFVSCPFAIGAVPRNYKITNFVFGLQVFVCTRLANFQFPYAMCRLTFS